MVGTEIVGTGSRPEGKTRRAIDGGTLPSDRNITQHLIVSRVLLVYKNDVFDLAAWNTGSRRNRVACEWCGVLDETIVAEDPVGVRGQLLRSSRNRDDVHRSECARSWRAQIVRGHIIVWSGATTSRIGNV